MGIDEKLSNMSRRCAGRSIELFGKITHNTQWQLTGHDIWMSACEEQSREQAKDAAKAMAAVAAYGLADRPMHQPAATAVGTAAPVFGLEAQGYTASSGSTQLDAIALRPAAEHAQGGVTER